MMKFFLFLSFMIPFLFMYNWYIFFVSLILLMIVVFIGFFDCYYTCFSYNFGGDILSYSLIVLSIWVILLMVLASHSLYKNNIYITEFLNVNLFLLLFLFLSFSTDNIFKFYFFFECSLIPTLMLIFGWGYQPERLVAGYYLLFYTLFFSLPMLLGIFYIYQESNTLSYFLIFVEWNTFLYFSMVMAFLVKMPLVFIHFWLPKAHVEAPISGSMILAGVLLKLGGYGLLRVFLFMFDFYFNFIFLGLSLFGTFIIGLLCLFQLDIKSLIAYSSVSHMGMVIGGLMTLNYWGMLGSLILMLGHGLCSSGMFCLANIVYERTGSRILLMNKGFLVFMPSMSLFWFILCANNMASPPSLNLLGELFLLNSILGWSVFSMGLLMFSSFISCLYSVYLYSFVNHGSLYSCMNYMHGGMYLEYMLLFMHWFPLNMLFLKIDGFSLFLF